KGRHKSRAPAPVLAEREQRAGLLVRAPDPAEDSRCVGRGHLPSHYARTAPRGSSPGRMRQPDRYGAPNTMSSGRTGTRLSSRPVAARMAATIAGVLEIVGGSPAPFAPYGASGGGCRSESTRARGSRG